MFLTTLASLFWRFRSRFECAKSTVSKFNKNANFPRHLLRHGELPIFSVGYVGTGVWTGKKLLLTLWLKWKCQQFTRTYLFSIVHNMNRRMVSDDTKTKSDTCCRHYLSNVHVVDMTYQAATSRLSFPQTKFSAKLLCEKVDVNRIKSVSQYTHADSN